LAARVRGICIFSARAASGARFDRRTLRFAIIVDVDARSEVLHEGQ
jgi:hypothetical protein